MKISVCMATYNGEKYIKKQVESILSQLQENDEVVIVDDLSTDNTRQIIRNFYDARILLFTNDNNIGFLNTFEKAIQLSTGNIIFLSDQDDVWIEGKINTIIENFQENHADVIFHDAIVVDAEDNILYNSLTEIRKITLNPIKNFVSNTFTGCCMAFRAEMKKMIIPIPKDAGYHDRWIAIIGGLSGARLKFIPDKLIYYVRHGYNVSPSHRQNIKKIIIDRVKLFKCIIRYFICNRTESIRKIEKLLDIIGLKRN